MARNKTLIDPVIQVEEIVLFGGLAFLAYWILSGTGKATLCHAFPSLCNLLNVGGPANQAILPPGGSGIDYAFNALTGQPSPSEISAPQSNVYLGPNAPAGNAGMAAFLAAGGDTSTIIPGTGQTSKDLIVAGWSWDQITQLWNQAFGTNTENLTIPGYTPGGPTILGGLGLRRIRRAAAWR